MVFLWPPFPFIADFARLSFQEKKKGMAKMIDVTNKTYERREKCLAEVAALKSQADKEQAQFEAEWRKLGSLIDQDKRNRELVRQREMEERDRRTQEVCSLSSQMQLQRLVA